MNTALLTPTQIACMTHYTRTGADHGGSRDMTRHSGPGTAHTRKWIPSAEWSRRRKEAQKRAAE